jgi:hypothetical protein
MSLGVLSSGFGLLSVLYTVWIFGTAEFAIFTIALAKLAIILLGLEIVPSQYSLFKMQADAAFSKSISSFYLAFGVLASAVTAMMVAAGAIASGSWLIVPYAFLAVMQLYLEVKAQSSGVVGAFGRMPAISNMVRVFALVSLGLAGKQPADAIWGSLCIGSALGQVYVLLQFPELGRDLIKAGPLDSLRRLVSVRSQYSPYIVNSVLKRLRDSFLPLFCDLVIPSKAEIGRLLVYTRAVEAVCGQVRLLETFMVNRAVRENLRHARRRIFWSIGPFGHAAVAVIALVLMYQEGIGAADVALASIAGLFVYPYILELFWRNDALASFTPRQVTISLLAFLGGMTIPPLVALALGYLSFPIIIGSYVLGQVLAAATYRLFPQGRDLSGHWSQSA